MRERFPFPNFWEIESHTWYQKLAGCSGPSTRRSYLPPPPTGASLILSAIQKHVAMLGLSHICYSSIIHLSWPQFLYLSSVDSYIRLVRVNHLNDEISKCSKKKFIQL